jgi:glucosamine-6-phosphate deaminase
VEVVILPDPVAVARLGADVVSSLAQLPAQGTLGLATGATPIPLYDELARRARQGRELSGLRAVALDEYVGLPAEDPRSYRHYLEQRVVRPLGLQLDALDGCAADLVQECDRYEQVLARGVDLQILGIGVDGHLGFNERGSSLRSRTRLKTLSDSTRTANAAWFAGRKVPLHVLTQGIGTILDARHLLLLATGAGKARALAAALEGPVTTMTPGSALQLHPHVTVLADQAASSRLSLADQHRHAHSHKPSWQAL